MTIKQVFRTTMRKVNGDLLTPVLIFNRLQGTKKFLLESSVKNAGVGRYSFIGANPRKTYIGTQTTLTEKSHLTGSSYHYEGELIALLKQVMPRITNRTEYPFTGGAIGYIHYGTGIADLRNTDSALPDVHFQVYDTLIIFDHLTEELVVLHTNIEAEQKEANLDELLAQILTAQPLQNGEYSLSEFTEQDAAFDQKVLEVQQLLMQENIQQVVLSQQLQADFTGDAFALYRKLRVASPSPYMFYIEFEDHTVIGTAPESLINVYDGVVKTNPIAQLQDEAMAQAVIEQTQQELHRVCLQDSFETTQKHVLEVSAKLQPTMHAIDALAAIVPASSITGLPKQQALQIIEQFEAQPRSYYGGAVGYIGFNGQIDFAHSLRTLVIQENVASTQVGTSISAASCTHANETLQAIYGLVKG